jgi:hypothetical protein
MNTYTTDEYNANPNGFYNNNWLKSIWLVLGGVVLLVLVLLYPKLSRKQPAPASFNMGGGIPQQPYAQPYQQPNAYGQPQQPYGQPPQYGQSQQASQYPQPSNPYQQPPMG